MFLCALAVSSGCSLPSFDVICNMHQGAVICLVLLWRLASSRLFLPCLLHPIVRYNNDISNLYSCFSTGFSYGTRSNASHWFCWLARSFQILKPKTGSGWGRVCLWNVSLLTYCCNLVALNFSALLIVGTLPDPCISRSVLFCPLESDCFTFVAAIYSCSGSTR